MSKVQDKPSEVAADEGVVVVDGPDGIAYSMTPDAAAETSDRLLFGAAKARGQELDSEQKKQGRILDRS